MKTEQRVREIIADVLCIDIVKVKDESSFYDDLGGDSIDLVDILNDAEKIFRITYMPDDPIFSRRDITVEEIIVDIKLKTFRR